MKKQFSNIGTLILSITIFIGCGMSKELSKETVIGKYQWHGIYGLASNITLKSDETFTYNWQTGLINGTTNGKWELNGKDLILNSDKQPIKEEDFRLILRQNTSTDQFEIQVIDNKGIALIAANCWLAKDTTYINGTSTDENGNCILPIDDKSNKLRFSYIGYREVEIPVDDLNSNSFILEIKETEDFYRYFTNQKWKYKRGRIYDPEIEKDRYTKRTYYEKK